MDFNGGKFSIIGENLPRNSQNIVLMLSTTPFIANDFHVNDELIGIALNHKIPFIDLCDFSNEDGMLPIFVHLFNSTLLILTFFVQILSTCWLKFIFLFSMSWNALKQCEYKDFNWNRIKNGILIPRFKQFKELFWNIILLIIY